MVCIYGHYVLLVEEYEEQFPLKNLYFFFSIFKIMKRELKQFPKISLVQISIRIKKINSFVMMT